MSKLSGRWGLAVCSLTLGCLIFAGSGNAFAAGKKVLKKTEFDPTAERVELFSAMESGQLNSKLVLKDSKQGKLLITNKTQQPLTVAMPNAMVGVQVLKQRGGNVGGNNGGGGNGGGGQSTGGGTGGFNNNGGGGGGGNNNLFSIPADKTISLPFNSVCLEHGKKEPSTRMNYSIAPVDTFSTDPVLERLLVNVAQQRVNPQVAQAAAWHLTDKMSWSELANKSVKQLGGRPATQYFANGEVQKAQQVLAILSHKVRQDAEKAKLKSESESVEKPAATQVK